MSQNSSDEEEDSEFFEPDEEIEGKLNWEEELERQYGREEGGDLKKDKVVGPGFSHQKKNMEQNKYYQGGKKKGKRVLDKTR